MKDDNSDPNKAPIVLYGGKDLDALLPHGPSFRFVDRVRVWEAGQRIVAELDLRPEAAHFAGHFPGRPLMPGVLITEALAQTCGLLLGLAQREREGETSPTPLQFHLAAVQMKYTRPVPPGLTLDLLAELDRDFGNLVRFRVEAREGGKAVAAGNLTLVRVESAG